MRAVLIIVLLAAVGAALVAWYAANGAGTSRALESIPVSDSPAALQASSPGPQPQARRTQSTPESAMTQAPPAPASLEDRPSSADAGSEWAKVYAGWSTPRLDERLIVLEATFHAEVERLCEARFEAGMYRVISGFEMAGDDSSYDVLAAQGADGVIQRTRAVPLAALDPATEHEEDDEARLEYQVASLPLDVYAELYRQRSEVEWLRATLASRVQGGEDPP